MLQRCSSCGAEEISSNGIMMNGEEMKIAEIFTIDNSPLTSKASSVQANMQQRHTGTLRYLPLNAQKHRESFSVSVFSVQVLMRITFRGRVRRNGS
jgi:hypothetical protein